MAVKWPLYPRRARPARMVRAGWQGVACCGQGAGSRPNILTEMACHLLRSAGPLASSLCPEPSLSSGWGLSSGNLWWQVWDQGEWPKENEGRMEQLCFQRAVRSGCERLTCLFSAQGLQIRQVLLSTTGLRTAPQHPIHQAARQCRSWRVWERYSPLSLS